MRMKILSSVLVALCVSVAAASELDIPKPGPVRFMSDVTGAFVQIGSNLSSDVVQVKSIAYQRTPDGKVTFLWVQGYTLKGQSVYYTRVVNGAQPIGLTEANLVVNDAGFIVFGPSDNPMTQDWSHPCGRTSLDTCTSRGCTFCGDAPACTCQGPIGGCDPTNIRWCDGLCSPGYICNTSVNDCRCERDVIVAPGVPGGGGKSPTDGPVKRVAPLEAP